ncbi:SusC/RagA family TonB-linked outer membrane protein [Sphingobacterium griseoflavum]|uniref:SusC/RagA family TonB-linked outer membrane protein n=1 Tax=Sphingobacterium griseoflavum TaxID=1474952 RepID=A0ABQ3HY43_9SPHI|nr:SusC/RagA family TonB-linked outer membrane protein [Sphingobacterium griseoflavum]GHE37535.1 SusC/RagA family TonB-linked outer membrane protein [Sphingobacterium griseoflavum]
MKQKLLSILVVLTCFLGEGFAQNRQVSGKVTSATDGSPISGASVALLGTTTATQTDAAGSFVMSVPPNSTLLFSYIGYVSQRIQVNNQNVLNVRLAVDETSLEEVVVTAQGIERAAKSIGYATQKVTGENLVQRSETNVLNALQGKVAGVNISSSSGQPGASTNINIRGITSFGGNNQPLIVVDGIIFSNDTDNSQNTLFGSQPANRLNDIPPDNIESINILKGPAASALYGSRASAGVLMITTKSGKGMAGKTEVTFNSSANFQNVAYLPRFQTSYGQGTQNLYNNQVTSSWGPIFGSVSEVVQGGTGLTVPYQAYPNNIRDFYNTGAFFQNSLNLAGGDDKSNFAAGLSSTIQEGIVPNSKYNRHTANLGGNRTLNNGIKIGGTITYSKTNQRGSTMGNGGSAFGQITRIPVSYDLNGTPILDAAGNRQYFLPNQNSPLWSVENEFFESAVDRAFGNLTIGYDITDWLNVSYRMTGDTYIDQRSQVLRIGAARAPQGSINEESRFRSELNGDLMVNARKDDLFLEGLTANLLLGQNINSRIFREAGVIGGGLSMVGFDNVGNASVFTGSYANRQLRRLVGHYAQLGLGYKDYLFLELTGRADKSSTLPTHNNTYFYPSTSLSFVPTTAFQSLRSDVLSFWKIRANAARVGRDADPYLLYSVYNIGTFGNNTASIQFPLSVGGSAIPGFNISTRIGNPNLRPEFVTSYEFGTQLGLFNNRIDIDFTYFSTRSRSQIFNVAVSNASGFDNRTDNIGEMTNRGIEVLLGGYPVRNAAFSWKVDLNFTRIRNNVVSIFGDEPVGGDNLTSTVIPAINSFIGISPSIAEGYPYGVIVGAAHARNEAGELLINPITGQFMPGVGNRVIANPQKDYTLGVANTLTYKNFNLNALFDIQKGGQLFSFSQVDMRSNGMIFETGIDREQPRILPGVIDNGDGTFRPNDIQISAQSYWQGLGGIGSEAAVFDATSYRLREVSLTYNLPQSVIKNTPFGQLSVGFSGRNLWMFAPGFPSDPEVNTQGAGNAQGLDLNGAPTTKNYGFNLRATF